MTRGIEINQLSSDERLAELADILATGLQRLRARKSSELCPDSGESSLHILPPRSGHADRLKPDGGSK
jgi:hypothetical protein